MGQSNQKRARGVVIFYKVLRLLAAFYLVSVVSFAFGALTMYFETWPYSILCSIKEFIKGDAFEQSSLLDKVAGEFGRPIRRMSVAWAPGVAKPLYRDVQHPSLIADHDPPMIYTTENTSRYFKALMTMFFFDDAPLSVILLDKQGDIRHRWNIGADCFQLDEGEVGPFFFGDFVVLDDGSLISFVSNRNGLFRISFSGELMWQIKGFFNHYMSLSDDGFLWVLGQPGRYADVKMRGQWNHTELVNKVDVRDGRIVKTIRIIDIMDRNLDRMDPFFAAPSRRVAAASGLLEEDLWHPNDIEVLPASIADRFPDFAAGDVALSFKALNMILVMDPETLKIKWWSQGATQGQHDPDWQPDGTMTFLNNRQKQNAKGDARHKFSAIQRFTFHDPLPESWIEGADYYFRTETNGWHDVSPDGRVLISSTAQGRVFEIAPDGKIAMEFIHRYHRGTAVWAGPALYVDPALIETRREE